MKKTMLIILSCFLISSLAANESKRHSGKDSAEYISWNDLKINNELTLLTTKSAMYKLFSKPDSTVNPNLDEICGSYFEDNFKYVFFGKTMFEVSGNQVVLSAVQFDGKNKSKLVSPKITFDNSLTIEKYAKTFPQSAKNRKEVLHSIIGKTICVRLATSKTDATDTQWHLYFTKGRLVRFELWMPC